MQQAGRRTGMRAMGFLEQSTFATSDIIGHMTMTCTPAPEVGLPTRLYNQDSEVYDISLKSMNFKLN